MKKKSSFTDFPWRSQRSLPQGYICTSLRSASQSHPPIGEQEAQELCDRCLPLIPCPHRRLARPLQGYGPLLFSHQQSFLSVVSIARRHERLWCKALKIRKKNTTTKNSKNLNPVLISGAGMPKRSVGLLRLQMLHVLDICYQIVKIVREGYQLYYQWKNIQYCVLLTCSLCNHNGVSYTRLTVCSAGNSSCKLEETFSS